MPWGLDRSIIHLCQGGNNEGEDLGKCNGKLPLGPMIAAGGRVRQPLHFRRAVERRHPACFQFASSHRPS
jgi:hypothetical protein